MKPHSMEIRNLVASAEKRGESAQAISLWLNISESSVYRLCRLAKENKLEPKPYPGRRSKLTPEQLTEIRETVEKENDITLEELIEKLSLPIKKSRLSLILIDMGFSFKKRRFIPKSSNVRMLL